MIRAIIFDCFGVLLGNAYKVRLAEVEQTDPEKAEEMRSINHASDLGIITRKESARYMADLLGVDAEEIYEEQDKAEVPNTELLSYISDLKKHFKIGLLSNISSRERLSIRFTDNQLTTHFDTVVASGDEGYVKPQAEIYELTAARLGVVPSECVMIDDISEFCDGARAVGMQAIQFISTKQCIADLNRLIDRGQREG
jgi:epoxide hydrolase-like predicted phosphatase